MTVVPSPPAGDLFCAAPTVRTEDPLSCTAEPTGLLLSSQQRLTRYRRARSEPLIVVGRLLIGEIAVVGRMRRGR
jgi:hypothetical protein